MNKKNDKTLKSLRLLFIGELFTIGGLFSTLNFMFEPLSYLFFLALIGSILSLIGVVKLAKVNKFFFFSFLCVVFKIFTVLMEMIFSLLSIQSESIATYETVVSILSKLSSMIFTYGVIRGCSKAATGNAKSGFAIAISTINFVAKIMVIGFVILSALIPTISAILSLISTFISLIAEICFGVYLYIIYKKAKTKLCFV